jgi:hypothetical protein
MIPVEGHKGLYRDENSNAIVNCNDYEYQEYLKTKNSMLNEKNEIQNLKVELTEIKSLLAKLLENKS